jgi:acetoin utilization deacetylase AcuC-like enzyme
MTAARTTAYYAHPDFKGHDMGRGHPECPARMDAIADRMRASGLLDALDLREPPLVSLDRVKLAHRPDYVDEVEDLNGQLQVAIEEGKRAIAQIDPDTALSGGSMNAVLRGAGAAVAATDAVIGGEVQNAFCAVRPPGHHATRGRAMGFCVFNNVAIAALHALEHHGLQRVAVVDFDVHHGNGTEDILAGDERVVMVSFYQHPFYPHGGSTSGAANMVNLPVPAGTRGGEVRKLVEQHWLPRLHEHQPEMIFISAGFDAHREDDLGQMGLVEDDYRWMTEELKTIADRYAQGRIVSCLEGGYNLSALGRSVEAHVRALAGV